MRAVVWYAAGDVRLEEVPEPRAPREDEVTVDVAWCGICATDVEEWRDGPHLVPIEPHPLTGRCAPLVLGHEVSGHVAAVGSRVAGLSVGDLVALDANMSCGECWWCRRHRPILCPKLAAIGLQADGGLAEALTVPAQMCLRVPDGVAADTAALAEPVAVAVRALRRGRLRLGESVAVVGAGMIGAACVVVARASGAERVVAVDPLPRRRELALRLGADRALDPLEPGFTDEVRALTHGRGADVAVDAAGAPRSTGTALAATRPGGLCVVVGLNARPEPLDLLGLVGGEKTLIGSLSHVWDEDFAKALRLLGDGVLTADDVVTTRLPLSDAVAGGFEALAADRDEIKIQITPR